jgi:hypothetical protein
LRQRARSAKPDQSCAPTSTGFPRAPPGDVDRRRLSRIACANWDRQLLSIELGELSDLPSTEGLDISVTGFEIHEIDLLIAGRAKPRSATEDVPPRPPRHAVTRPGDLWLLGDHRLLCGDARDADDLGRLMEGALAAAAFCASPAKVARSAVLQGKTEPGSASDCGEMSPEQYREFLSETLYNVARVSSEGGVHFVCIDWRRVGDLTRHVTALEAMARRVRNDALRGDAKAARKTTSPSARPGS